MKILSPTTELHITAYPDGYFPFQSPFVRLFLPDYKVNAILELNGISNEMTESKDNI